MTVYVLDHFYVLITLLITVGYQLSGFAIAWIFQFDKITDFTGGSNFFIIALITLTFGDTYHARNIVVSVLQMIWAVRIGGFLLFRVLKRGSDARFDQIRGNFWQFLTFWIAQILWVFICSLPTTILNSPAVSRNPGGNPKFGTAGDIIGIIIWAIGLAIEGVADIQKYQWKSSNPPKGATNTKGLWKYSRHPPYFGEIMCWWGIWAIAVSPSIEGNLPTHVRAGQLGAMVSPLFTMAILIFGSGIPYSAQPTAKKYFLIANGPSEDGKEKSPEELKAWHNYKNLLDRTSILIPIPPSIYQRFPKSVKIALLDLPMFNFDEEKDGPAAIREAEEKQRKKADDHA